MREEDLKKIEQINIAINELVLLNKEKQISGSSYLHVKEALIKKKEAIINATIEVAQKPVELEQPFTEIEVPKPVPVKPQKQTQPRPKPIKKERSPEEKRKRRLTYILTSGVALLLLSGVLLALTSWLVFQPVTKVVLISGIAIVFAGMSFLAHRLNIKQTMLAFLMLFAFFVPIVFFSVSYYGILGSYLSIGGEGSMLFAALAALTCAVLYAFLYSIEAHRLFQLVALVAMGVMALFAAGYVASTIEMYVLTLALVIFAQLICWKPLMDTSKMKAYLPLLPWFVLAQLLLVSFIQVVLFTWSHAGFINYILLGVLFYSLACRHKNYRVLSIPAVLSFSLGMTGFVSSADYIGWSLNAVVVLALPVSLLGLYVIERKADRGAMMFVPLRVMFFVTVALTHMYGQIMLFFGEESVYPNLFYLTIIGTTVLLILSGWQAKQRTTLLFSYLLSFYSTWFLLHFYLADERWASILLIGISISVYVFTVFATSLNKKLLLHPLKLVATISTSMILFELTIAQEWMTVTICFIVASIISSFCYRFEQQAFKQTAGVMAVCSLFLASICAYFAFWDVSSILMPVDWANHFLMAAIVLVGLYFLYIRVHGLGIARLSFIGGGVLFGFTLIQVLVNYPLFAQAFPALLTLYAVAGGGYFVLCSLVVFKKKEYYLGIFAFSLLSYLSLTNFSFADSSLVHWGLLLLMGGIFTWIGRALKKKTAYGGTVFYLGGQLLLLVMALFYLPFIYVASLSPQGIIIPMAFLLLEVIRPFDAKWRPAQSIAFVLLLLIHNLIWFDHISFVTVSDSLLLTGALLLLSVLWKPISYQSTALRVGLGILNVYPLALIQFETFDYGLGKILIVIAIAAITLYYIEEKWKNNNYCTIPLVLASLVVLVSEVTTLVSVSLLLLLAISFKAVGVHYIGWSLFHLKRFNIYQVISTLLVLTASFQLRTDSSFATEIELVMASILFAYLLVLFIREVNPLIRFIKALSILIGFYYPYHLFISLISLADEYMTFIYTVPFMIMVSLLLRAVARDQSWRQPIEITVVVLSFAMMSLSTLFNQTLYGSLTLSGLAILAVFVGFYLRYAAYFLTGTVALLINTLYATRAFWASIPWWIYLMAGGVILIGFATYQELKKREEDTTLGEQWNKTVDRVMNYFKKWK